MVQVMGPHGEHETLCTDMEGEVHHECGYIIRFNLTSVFQVFSTINNQLADYSPDSFISNMPSLPAPPGASVLTPPPTPPASRGEQRGTLRPASATAQHNPGNTVLLATCLIMSPTAPVSRYPCILFAYITVSVVGG